MNTLQKLFGCHNGHTFWNGREFDHSKPLSHLAYRLWSWRNHWRDMPQRCRNRLADWLSRFAAWLRHEKWYVSDSWHGVPGNRAAELRQQIWVDVVCLSVPIDEDDRDRLGAISNRLNELAQAAGEKWGHIEPKDNHHA